MMPNGAGRDSGNRSPSEGSLGSRVVGAAGSALSGTGALALVRIITLAALARLLTPEHFGLMAAASVVISFFEVVVRVGVGPVLIQRSELGKRHVQSAFWISILLGLLLMLLVHSFSAAIASVLFAMPDLAPVLRVAAWMLPLHSLSVVPLALLQRRLAVGRIVQIELAAYLLGFSAFSIALAAQGFGVWALAYGYVIQAGLVALFAVLLQPHSRGLGTDGTTLRELTFVGGGFAAARFGNFFAERGDSWVVGRWLGEASLGVYKYAYELATLPGNLFGQAMDRVLFPAMAMVQSQPERLARAFSGGLAVVSSVVLAASVAMIILTEDLVALILGAGWEGVVEPFRLIAVVATLRTSQKIHDSLARAVGAVYRRAWRQNLYAALVVGACLLGQRWGVEGAAAGRAVAIAASYLLMLHLSASLTPLSWRRALLIHLRGLPLALLTLSGVALGLWLSTTLGFGPLGRVSVAGAAAAVALASGLLIAPRHVIGPDSLPTVRVVLATSVQRVPTLRRLPGVHALLAQSSEAQG